MHLYTLQDVLDPSPLVTYEPLLVQGFRSEVDVRKIMSTVKAVDHAGNEISCYFYLEIYDNERPVIDCPVLPDEVRLIPTEFNQSYAILPDLTQCRRCECFCDVHLCSLLFRS
jgi:hypothetical protein